MSKNNEETAERGVGRRAEGDLSLRHCLDLNVNSYIQLCTFQKPIHNFGKQQFAFVF